MTKNNTVFAIVPAAGVGSRMGADRPKQYLKLGSECVLQVTLDKLLSIDRIHKVLVCLSHLDTWFKSEVRASEQIVKIPGGSERSESVFNALAYLVSQGYGECWALVHDAARPCVDPSLIDTLLNLAFAKQEGCILAAQATDTIKSVKSGVVQQTLDRQHIFLAHTPQVFKINALYEALQVCAESGHVVTDESSAMEFVGCMPHVIVDSRENVKVTVPEDLDLANWVLRKQGWLD